MCLKTRDRAESHRSSGNLFKVPQIARVAIADYSSVQPPAPRLHPTGARRMVEVGYPNLSRTKAASASRDGCPQPMQNG